MMTDLQVIVVLGMLARDADKSEIVSYIERVVAFNSGRYKWVEGALEPEEEREEDK